MKTPTTQEFWESVLGGYVGDVICFDGEFNEYVVSSASLLKNKHDLFEYFRPTTPSGALLCFAAWEEEGERHGARLETVLAPVTLKKGKTTRFVWPLREALNVTDDDVMELANLVQPRFAEQMIPIAGAPCLQVSGDLRRLYRLADIEDGLDSAPLPPPEELTTFEDIEMAIDWLPARYSPGDLDKITAAISALENLNQKSTAEKRLKDKTGFSVKQTKASAKEHSKKSVPTFTGKKDKDGLYEFPWQFDLDEVDAGKVLATVVLEQNGNKFSPKPQITYSPEVKSIMEMETDAKGHASFAVQSFKDFQAAGSEKLAFVKYNDDAIPGKRKGVPDKVAEKFYYSTCKGRLPKTPTIVKYPCFLPNGTLITKNGWYQGDGYNVYLNMVGLKIDEVPSKPTPGQVTEAVDWLVNDVLVDFHFEDVGQDGKMTDKPGRAHALAMLITSHMRRLINGPTPVFFAIKPETGAGGTLLASLPARLTKGGEFEQMSFSPSNDEENEKKLISACLAGQDNIFLDDIKHLTSRYLLQTLTADYITGRVLGGSRDAKFPNDKLWTASGVNTVMSDEMRRRMLFMTLACPEVEIDRREYKKRWHQNADGSEEEITYVEWFKNTRGKTMWAILVLIQNWVAKGRPAFTARKKTSFDGWSRSVGGVLEVSGIEGFLGVGKPASFDHEEAANRKLVRNWYADPRLAKTENRVIDEANLIDLAFAVIDVEGHNDVERRRRTRARLADLQGRRFDVGTAEKPHYVIVRRVETHDGVTYSLQAKADQGAEVEVEEVAA